MITIREETENDQPAVQALLELAFEQANEAAIVDQLRENCSGLLSLVAIDGEQVVGHILFSPTHIEGLTESVQGMGLAPMAVLPDRQNEGIGSSLVREGLDWLEGDSCPFVIVLGHPEYYPRFGFNPAKDYGIKSQWQGIPEDSFMILILDHAQMEGFEGTVFYQPEFEM